MTNHPSCSGVGASFSVHAERLVCPSARRHDILERLGQFAVDVRSSFAQGEGDAINASLRKMQIAEVYVGLVAWRSSYVPPGQH